MCRSFVPWISLVLLLFGANGLWAASPADLDDRQRADQLLQHAVEAIGDPVVFDSIDAIRLDGRSYDAGSSEAARTTFTFLFSNAAKGLWLHSLHVQGETAFERAVAGETSWARGLGILSEELHRDAVRYSSTKLFAILRNRSNESMSRLWVGTETQEDKVVDLVEIRLEGHRSVIEIDRATGRVVAIAFPSSEIQEQHSDGTVRRAYDDYRRVGGLDLPFAQTVTLNGEPHSRYLLDSIELDPSYLPTLFDPKD